jgi:hypothetical protein
VRDEELNEELRTHLEMDVKQRMARGESRANAEAAARREFGNLTHVAEVTREMWGGQWLEQLRRDVRYALRSLTHSPMFTTVVVIALALGIGANTAIFSVVRGVLLKPLPHRDGDRLVYLRQSANGPGQSDMTFSVPEVRDLRAGVPSFAGIAEFSAMSAVHGTSDGPVRIRVGLVTGNYFEVMGLSPVVGRLTHPSDDGAAAAPVAVLGYDYWKTRFGGDSAVLGKKILLNDRPVTVIGVLQPAPFFPERVDALLNLVNSAHHLSATMQQSRTHRMTSVVARVKTASTIDKARAEVATVYSALQRAFPEAYPASARYQIAVLPLKDILGEHARLTLWLLMASAAFVLIVSAANVTNLTLMRGIRREHELVVRTALGAARSRLRRLLLVENLVLATLGGALGIVIAIAGVRLLTVFAARYSPRANEIRLARPRPDVVFPRFAAERGERGIARAGRAATRERKPATAAASARPGRSAGGGLGGAAGRRRAADAHDDPSLDNGHWSDDGGHAHHARHHADGGKRGDARFRRCRGGGREVGSDSHGARGPSGRCARGRRIVASPAATRLLQPGAA